LETQNTSDICVIFAKNHGWPQNWGGGCALQPGPKTATADIAINLAFRELKKTYLHNSVLLLNSVNARHSVK